MRIVHVVTVPETLNFIGGLLKWLADHDFEIEVVSSPGPELSSFTQRHAVVGHPVAMPRRLSPVADLLAAGKLVRLLRSARPEIVHAHTPKGGLLGMVAGRLAGVPHCVYQMRGLLTLTARGYVKPLLAAAERLSCSLADKVICQSQSLRDYAVSHRLCNAAKALVMGKGSNGVDVSHFDPDRLEPARAEVRNELGIPASAPVVGFVGRLVRDKGVPELLAAWHELARSRSDLHLLLVGPFESRDSLPAGLRGELLQSSQVHAIGRVPDVARYYTAMDVLALPSHREGFPNAPLEAAAMRLPVVTTRAVGCVDAVEDGHTGTLVPVGDVAALVGALARYLECPQLRAEHGGAGRARVARDFTPQAVWQDTLELYRSLLTAPTAEPTARG